MGLSTRIMLFGVAVCGAAAWGLAGSAHAATIAFGPAIPTVDATTDVVPAGTVDRAYSFNGVGPLSVNGVTFTGMGPGATVAGDTNNFTNSFGGYGAIPTATGDYATLLSNGNYTDASPATATITLNGLTAGTAYTLEVFVNDTRGCCGFRSEVVSGDAGAGSVPVTLTYANGTHAFGTFVADGSGSQVINFSGPNGDVQVNGLVLSHAVPEPAGLVLLGLGAFGLLIAARRRAS